MADKTKLLGTYIDAGKTFGPGEVDLSEFDEKKRAKIEAREKELRQNETKAISQELEDMTPGHPLYHRVAHMADQLGFEPEMPEPNPANEPVASPANKRANRLTSQGAGNE